MNMGTRVAYGRIRQQIGRDGRKETLWDHGNIPDFDSHLGYIAVHICHKKQKDLKMVLQFVPDTLSAPPQNIVDEYWTLLNDLHAGWGKGVNTCNFCWNVSPNQRENINAIAWLDKRKDRRQDTGQRNTHKMFLVETRWWVCGYSLSTSFSFHG